MSAPVRPPASWRQPVDAAVVGAPVLTVRGLTKGYRRTPVLRGVDLEVEAGSLVGVQGENGAGKSTLLKCLTGLLRPDSGQVEVRGALGYCPQQPIVIAMLTAREFLRLMAAAYALPRADAAARAEALLETFGATKVADTRIDRMSGGTVQKVNLIAAILHRPSLLLLDEPYQGFDYETYETFWRYVEGYRDEGGSLVVVSHLHTEKDRFDRMLSLHDGRLVEEAR